MRIMAWLNAIACVDGISRVGTIIIDTISMHASSCVATIPNMGTISMNTITYVVPIPSLRNLLGLDFLSLPPVDLVPVVDLVESRRDSVEYAGNLLSVSSIFKCGW